MKIIDQITASKAPFYSLEFFPPKTPDLWENFFTAVNKLQALNPLFASVTYGAGGSTQKNTLELTRRLKQDCNIEPMAHLTCVGANPESITEFVNELRDGGVTNILALRGDAPSRDDFSWETSHFKHASDLVELVHREHSDFGIAAAGYPAPHPESKSYGADLQWIAHKMHVGGDFLITQLFFDVRLYVDYVKRLSLLGVEKPVLPGVFPIQSFESMRRILSLCGASIPGPLYLQLEEAHNKGGNEAVKEVGIAFAANMIRQLIDCGAPGIHLYTLNQAETCLRIAEEVKM